MKRPYILVTGSQGQLGNELSRAEKKLNSFDFLYVDREDVDLTDEAAFLAYVKNKSIRYIINCAAYTAVDQAESDQQNAEKINAGIPAMLADYCLKNQARLIHISTDYVFDGNGNSPIKEDAKPNPISVYGKTKLRGEELLLQRLANAYIIRTAWVYSVFGKNFVKTMLNLANQRKELNVIYDQVGTPTSALDLAHVILHMVEKIEQGVDRPGIYHYTNEGVTSWYDFAIAIFKHSKLTCHVKPIPTSAYVTAATRPRFSLLDKSKIKEAFSISIPHWSESLARTIDELSR